MKEQELRAGHTVKVETRKTGNWVVCTCRWSCNVDKHPAGEWGAITDHRLGLIEGTHRLRKDDSQ